MELSRNYLKSLNNLDMLLTFFFWILFTCNDIDNLFWRHISISEFANLNMELQTS